MPSPLSTRLGGDSLLAARITSANAEALERALASFLVDEPSDEDGWRVARWVTAILEAVEAQRVEPSARPSLARMLQAAGPWIEAHPRFRPYSGPLWKLRDVENLAGHIAQGRGSTPAVLVFCALLVRAQKTGFVEDAAASAAEVLVAEMETRVSALDEGARTAFLSAMDGDSD